MPQSTVEEVARAALAAVNSNAGLVAAGAWVAERYRQLASRARFRHLRRVGELTVPAAISAGTVAATQGSRTVTPNATALAAWSPSIVGRFVRMKTAWYEITGFDGATATLASEYAEDTTTASTYRLVARFIPLDEDVRWHGAFVHMRRRNELDKIALASLDAQAPDRAFASIGPTVVADVGFRDGRRIVEMYPYSTQAEAIRYAYWSEPPKLTLDELVPGNVGLHVLREGALIDVMRRAAADAAKANRIEEAAYWRNEYRAQSTSWERQILEAIRADIGDDDVGFVLRSAGVRPLDIRSARDEVFARGARP